MDVGASVYSAAVPVVLFEAGGVARSGHLYGDRTGVEYEYPAGRYERWIEPGERFLYQAPRVGYVGCGVIGEIAPSLEDGRLICQVHSVRFFDEPVGLKDSNGDYFEADPTYWKGKIYWGQGVRPISDERYDSVIATAGVASSSDPDPVAPAYADPATARAVEDMSVAVAVEHVHERFGESVKVMPRNNPGFDLLVGSASSPTRYVEVKGTQSAQPVFFMSEGEREFSVRNAAKYTLLVVSGIDLGSQTFQALTTRDGAVAGDGVQLMPSQWRGRLEN